MSSLLPIFVSALSLELEQAGNKLLSLCSDVILRDLEQYEDNDLGER